MAIGGGGGAVGILASPTTLHIRRPCHMRCTPHALDWPQVGLLCNHEAPVAVCACQGAARRLLSYTPHDISLSQKRVAAISRHMPCDKICVQHHLLRWLRRNATCDGTRCAPWHIVHNGSHTEGWTPSNAVIHNGLQPAFRGRGRGGARDWDGLLMTVF